MEVLDAALKLISMKNYKSFKVAAGVLIIVVCAVFIVTLNYEVPKPSEWPVLVPHN